MNYLPLALTVGAVSGFGYAALAGSRIGRLATALRVVSVVATLEALLLVESCSVRAMVGVGAAEIQTFARIFETALRRADISIKAAAIALYGRDDHARLRHELEAGTLDAVRLLLLPAVWWREFLALVSDAKALAIVTEQDIARVARIFAAAPRPKAVAAVLEVACPSAAS